MINVDGTNPQRLTFNTLEERSPDWSPDGTKLVYMCRFGAATPFEICVMNSDGTGSVEVLTNNAVPDLTPGWSPDGTRISFFRGLDGQEQIHVMNYLADENGDRHVEVLTAPPSTALLSKLGHPRGRLSRLLSRFRLGSTKSARRLEATSSRRQPRTRPSSAVQSLTTSSHRTAYLHPYLVASRVAPVTGP